MADNDDLKVLNFSEVTKHKSKDDIWIVVHGRVYDVTHYLEEHPGGANTMLEVGGQDATSSFEDVGHDNDARETMGQFLIGKVEGAEEDEEQHEVKPKAVPTLVQLAAGQDQASPAKSKKTQISRIVIRILLGAGGAFLTYEAAARLPSVGWLNLRHGGFWRGFLIASVAGFSAITTIVLYLSKYLHSEHHTISSWPAHYKPAALAKPITQAHGFLKPQEYQKLPLVEKDKLSSNSYLLVFKLPTPNSILGLPIGQHISIRAEIDGKTISRSYTPVSNNTDPGELRLVIKIYQDGQLTGKYLQNLQVGDEVEFRGPKGAMRYRRGMTRKIGMIAGGTGINPMYQIIRAICEDPRDKTWVHLLYGSIAEEDILMRKELDDFAKKYPENFAVTYVLSNPSDTWKGPRGFITKDMVAKELPRPDEDSKILLCGPPGLIDAMKKSLVDLGFEKPGAVSHLKDQVFNF